MPTRKTTQEFLNDIKSKGVWDENYDYSKLEYHGSSKKVLIIDKTPQTPWRPSQVYHYMQWNNDPCDFVVDISEFIDKKMAAILAYSSQFYDEKSKEPKTPISSQQFLDSIQNRAADLGRMIGVKFAEGFTTQRQLAVSQISDLI